VADKREFINLLGEQSVSDEPKVLESYSSDRSFVTKKKPSLVVRPRTSDEVRKLILFAGKTGHKLVPVSSTPQGFRGDAVPSVDGTVIVDLSQMTQIEWINRRNRVAVVEPGVRFGELARELEAQGLRTMMPLCPREGKSVVGAFMEREPFTVPKYAWDMGDPVASCEIVLGDGYPMRTGGGSGPAPTLAAQRAVGGAQKLPISPFNMDAKRIVQGSQGSMGICTWQALRCELLPEYETVYFAGAKSLEKLVEAAYRLIYLRLTDEQYILDSLNFACLVEKEPKKIEALRKKLPPFILVLSIGGYGTNAKGQYDYKKADLEEEAAKLGIELSSKAGTVTEKAYREKVVRKASEEPYWKLRYKGDCREVFFIATLARAAEFVAAARECVTQAGFDAQDMGIYLQQVIQGTACHMEFDLYAAPEDMAKVEGVYAALSKKIYEMGGYYSRPYGMWSDLVYPAAEVFVKYARGMKKLFDPNLVLNPEKLCFKGM